jgi:hypothetical protein
MGAKQIADQGFDLRVVAPALFKQCEAAAQGCHFRVGEVLEFAGTLWRAPYLGRRLFLGIIVILIIGEIRFLAQELADGATAGFHGTPKAAQEKGLKESSAPHPLLKQDGECLCFLIGLAQISAKNEGVIVLLSKESDRDLRK